MKRIEFRAMGSRMLAVLDADTSKAEAALAQVPAWFEEWEQALSRFRPGNELDRLNRSGGLPMAVSKTLWDVIQTATTAENDTGGLVRATLLDALARAGYDRSFELLPPLQTGHSFALPGLPDPSAVIVWDVPSRSLVLPESVRLDLGGVTKGWAANRAIRRLSYQGPALMDAGGDIAISGPRADGQGWPVGVSDPFQSGEHFETLRLTRCGVATSGKDYHTWLKDGVWHHHIIDPRTGLPADTDVLAVTVIAPTVMQAEAAAKAVLILGSQAGLDWLEGDGTLAGILVLEDGDRIYSKNMERYLWRV
jgi:thiamine biosynthesis lipoprotein